MKCKLSKLFFLALIGAVSVNGYSQTAEERKNITKGYDLKKNELLANELKQKAEESYAKALEIVKEKNLPISGLTPQGAFFSLKGIDAETGEILYYQTSNNTSTKSSVQTARAQHLYPGGSLGINIQGQGMIVGIWDGGQPLAGHTNLGLARVTNKDGQFLTSQNPEEQLNGENHATHVAGTMIGNGTGNVDAKGIASQSYLWSNTWTNDISEMTTQAGQGLLVSNHSYGIRNESYVPSNPGHFGRYSTDSNLIDVLTKNNDMYLPVYAAGNDHEGIYLGSFPLTQLNPTKGGLDQLTNENTAKNPVVVAAVEGITDYVSTGYVDDFVVNNVVLSEFSQWGPTDDFRIKPDISAKGVDVFSSIATGVNNYTDYDGTSMAAPSVTAVFALWQQYRNQLWPLKGHMKAASLKALMAHTASEAGSYKENSTSINYIASPEGPDPRFGWGLINAKGGAEVMKAAKANQAVFEELTLSNNQTYSRTVTASGLEPLVATIAWTDGAASVVSETDSSNSLLINDLDLRVRRVSNNTVVLPWALNKSWNSLYAHKADNNVDPIEKVTYYSLLSGNAQVGDYEIIVTHKGSLVGGAQNFTLVVSGIDTTVSNENFEFDGLKIYPNPVSDYLNISANLESIENSKIVIYDVLGKKIYENTELFSNTNQAQIDMSSFNKGIYLVEISKGSVVETKKIIKK